MNAQEHLECDPELVDAAAPGLASADFIFVFGTAHPTAAPLAADIFRRGLAPFVVLTGGRNRGRPEHNEAERHRELLLEHGVPGDAIILENQSRSTVENVTFASPLIDRHHLTPHEVIAVVKWYHRRALITLAAHMPAIARIYSVDYEPRDAETGDALTRSNWVTTAYQSIARETRYIRELMSGHSDPLVRSELGWVRSSASNGP